MKRWDNQMASREISGTTSHQRRLPFSEEENSKRVKGRGKAAGVILSKGPRAEESGE